MKKIPFYNIFPHDLFAFTQFLGLVMMAMGCVFVTTFGCAINHYMYTKKTTKTLQPCIIFSIVSHSFGSC